MKIIVCMKQVPAAATASIDPLTKTIVRTGRNAVTNPFDLHALQAALDIRKATSGTVTAITMGIPAAEKVLRDAVAPTDLLPTLETENGYIRVDRRMATNVEGVFAAGSDTLATSYALSLGVKKLGGADLIVCGKMAVDGDTAQIGPELAARLKVPHVSDVFRLEATEKDVTVWREMDGCVQQLRLPLPAVLTVTRELNVPRLPSIAGVLRSKKVQVQMCNAAQAGADENCCGLKGSPTQVVATAIPRRTRTVTEVSGSQEQRTKVLLEIIKGGVSDGTGD